MPDKLTMEYIEEERERCAQLVMAMSHDHEFLIHCIRYSVQPSEVEERRKRFEEFPVELTAEDLM
jgi:hypothetical protein